VKLWIFWDHRPATSPTNMEKLFQQSTSECKEDLVPYRGNMFVCLNLKDRRVEADFFTL
jgi:hypothetical protein